LAACLVLKEEAVPRWTRGFHFTSDAEPGTVGRVFVHLRLAVGRGVFTRMGLAIVAGSIGWLPGLKRRGGIGVRALLHVTEWLGTEVGATLAAGIRFQ
jgi:hypothetical protein